MRVFSTPHNRPCANAATHHAAHSTINAQPSTESNAYSRRRRRSTSGEASGNGAAGMAKNIATLAPMGHSLRTTVAGYTIGPLPVSANDARFTAAGAGRTNAIRRRADQSTTRHLAAAPARHVEDAAPDRRHRAPRRLGLLVDGQPLQRAPPDAATLVVSRLAGAGSGFFRQLPRRPALPQRP